MSQKRPPSGCTERGSRFVSEFLAVALDDEEFLQRIASRLTIERALPITRAVVRALVRETNL